MGAIIGTLLVATGVILFSWSVLEFRRPNPPLWTKQENYAISFSVGITTLFSLGTASYINGFYQESYTSLNILEWAVMAIVYGGVAIFLVSLNRWWKRIRVESPAASFLSDGAIPASVANDTLTTTNSNSPKARPKAA